MRQPVQVEEHMTKNDPRQRAAGWVTYLGWDPMEALDDLETQDEPMVVQVESILRLPDNGPEPGKASVEMLSRAGIRIACQTLDTFARWEDDGGAS